MSVEDNSRFKGRGSAKNPPNPYHQEAYVRAHEEGLDEPQYEDERTKFFSDHPKTIVNKVESPDVGMGYSINPYQGCEHGCIYCYARNSHQYWGYSAGLDFERNIIVKENAPALLEKRLLDPQWEPHTIVLSGNTDCYQPIERKKELTRSMLAIFAKYRHPVSFITKNALILRDLDLLADLAQDHLVRVNISITSLDKKLRQAMEPRTAASRKRMQVVERLTAKGIPVNVMAAPVIPSLNDHELPEIVKQAADHGAESAAYTVVRLNGAIGDIFKDWLYHNFPERADKVLNQIKSCHGGQINDSRFGKRIKGEGKIAQAIESLFRMAVNKHFKDSHPEPLNTRAFKKPGQMTLFSQ